MAEEQVGDEEFLDIAREPARARALRSSLQRLAQGGGGEVVQEMAKEVLAGRVGLREAMQNSACREALSDRVRDGFRALEELPPDARHAAEDEGRRRLTTYQDEIDEERRQRGGAAREAGPRHDGRGWRLY
ncbi:hypothetical protein OG746_13740 [Streptomyces sp. NBC_01016]|uniref:hypothetical protein n=1 Tax=Streptomyces sp. NBC_01016 TaxID=2903720 RepID=UPI00224FF957|nr:hypothetical protein [Streptomyces sp. NBC_01016]MCX4829793.1 hypothetical protein [Streptomyces sp. NBC_01016]